MRSLKMFYLIATTLLVIYLVAEYNKPPSVVWKPTLSYNDKVPFGTYILYRQVRQIFPHAELRGTNATLFDQFHDKNIPNSNYIIIAGTESLGKYDFKEMVSYIDSGNSVFISAFNWGGVLTDTLKIKPAYAFDVSATDLNFTNNKLRRPKNYQFDKGIASGYFDSFDTAKAVVLSRNGSGKSNLLCYKFGKGSLYLCANPQLFTNYSLLTPQGADYAAKAMSYMPVQPLIYWDHLQNGDIPEDESPMRVFFANPVLKWAYYISLFGMVIFILYEMKRRQRIIPIIEPLKNSTVDFVNVVGQVYYEQRNNANISQKKVLYFLEHLRTNYYLKTNKLDKEFIEKLALKTGIEYAFAEELVVHIHYISGQRVSDNELIQLNQLIEQFYIKTR